jgi:hypothetical protein
MKVLVAVLWTGLAAALFAQAGVRDFKTDSTITKYEDWPDSDFETNGNGTIMRYVGWSDTVNIPAQIGGAPVTGIGREAFAKNGLVGGDV